MESASLGLVELLCVLGIALALGIWEFLSLRRDQPRAPDAERTRDHEGDRV